MKSSLESQTLQVSHQSDPAVWRHGQWQQLMALEKVLLKTYSSIRVVNGDLMYEVVVKIVKKNEQLKKCVLVMKSVNGQGSQQFYLVFM